METRNHRMRPGFTAPMICKNVRELPRGNRWVYEVKRNGRRTIAVKSGADVTLFTGDGKPLACSKAEQAVAQVHSKTAVLDCELVTLGSNARFRNGAPPKSEQDAVIQLYAFDLLQLNGRALMHEPLERRKERLCTATLDSFVLFSPSLTCEPELLVEEVRRLSLEGVVAKRKGSIYEPGKCSGSWVKILVSRGGRVLTFTVAPLSNRVSFAWIEIWRARRDSNAGPSA